MKKSNKLLIIILTCIVTLMMGYALFSENITVTGTATAKGNFDIEVTCTKGVPSNLQGALNAALDIDGIYTANFGYPKTENGYTNDTCTVNGNNISYSANLLYPGALRYFIVKTKNIGTISAKLDSLEYLNGGEKIKNETCIYNKSDNTLVSCNDYYTSHIALDSISGFKYIIGIETASGQLYTMENDEFWEHSEDGMYFYIDSNESMYFVYGLSWNELWTDKTKYLTFEGEYELPFVQFVH